MRDEPDWVPEQRHSSPAESGVMEIKKLKPDFSVCKVADYSLVNLDAEYCFIGKTDEEKSEFVQSLQIMLRLRNRPSVPM